MTLFTAPDAWWRGVFEGLEDEQRRRLLDGRLTIHVLGLNGYDEAPLEVPDHLLAEFVPRLP